jgi:cytochrome P450
MEQASALIFDYLGPSLDTTITATTNAVKLFGEHPDQWRVLREKPYMVPNAINEVIRLESPVQGFSRRLTRDTAWGSQFLPQGARVLLLYGSANRDERRWEQPRRFEITRANNDHIGFGHGVHACAGANLARLEMAALLTAMVSRIEEIRIDSCEVLINNFLRGFRQLLVTVHPAQATLA